VPAGGFVVTIRGHRRIGDLEPSAITKTSRKDIRLMWNGHSKRCTIVGEHLISLDVQFNSECRPHFYQKSSVTDKA
jgi:hypothetical protein